MKRGAAASPVHAREREVVRAQRREIRGRELPHGLRVVDAGRAIAVQRSRPGDRCKAARLVPSTSPWLASICSSSVEPERGKPEDEDRRVVGIAGAAQRLEELCRVHLEQPIVHDLGLHRVVCDLRTLLSRCRAGRTPRHARNRRGPRRPWRARTGSSPPTARLSPWRRDALLHFGDRGVVETIGLEVREAPVGFARFRASPGCMRRRRRPRRHSRRRH